MSARQITAARVGEGNVQTCRFWTGQRALGLGLVDGLGDFRQVIAGRFGEQTKFLMIEPKRKLLSFGGGGASAHVSSSIVGDAAEHAVERAYFARYGL